MPIPNDLIVGKWARILIVDDDPDLSQALKEVLLSINPKFHVVSAATGFETGKQIMNLLPDLILLDIYMPGMDGFEVCSSIRNDNRTHEVKIIAITGDRDERIKNRIMTCGANGIIYKPIFMEELKKQVANILELDLNE